MSENNDLQSLEPLYDDADVFSPISQKARTISLFKNYEFEVVEFALASKGDVSRSPFARIIDP